MEEDLVRSVTQVQFHHQHSVSGVVSFDCDVYGLGCSVMYMVFVVIWFDTWVSTCDCR